jgi:hypothetical protein
MQKHQAVEPFVEFLMEKEQVADWRTQLCNKRIFTTEQLEALTDQEVTLVRKALLMNRFVNLTHTQLMQEIERHQFRYCFDMGDDDYRAGAVCY